ncbi:MAG TPA: hypothetical protein VFD91_16770, partial [Mariniphaga sp.]|nr:hypothetical protein [Mariniphaga sp.]
MITKFFLSQQFLNFGVSIIFIFSLGCLGEKNQNIVIENDNFRYVIGKDGKNLQFTEKQTESDLLFKDTTSHCAYIIKAGQQHALTDAGFQNDTLYFDFKPVDFSAKVLVTRNEDHVNFKVIDVKGQADEFNFINIPLVLEGMTSETFATCALSMNLFTHVQQLPALQTHLWATCYDRFGMKGAELTIVGVPQEDILPAIRTIIKDAEDIPFSDKGGAWAQLEKEGYGSYLMDFGSLTEETVDETIRQCKKLGFNQVVIHGGGAFYKHGEFELYRSKWPDGWQSFKRINDRLHEAGIASILLTYTFFIDKQSQHVTPVPSEDLGYFNSFTLAEPLKPEDDEIVVKESTAEVSPITGFFVRNSRTLRIGNELIEFSGVTTAPPYKFTGLTRGVSNTKVLNHSAGEKA